MKSSSSQKKLLLKETKAGITFKILTIGFLQFAIKFVLGDGIESVLRKNWTGAHDIVPVTSVPQNADLIKQYLVPKVKVKYEGISKLKARLVPHDNWDYDQSPVRCKSDFMDRSRVFFTVSLTSILGIQIVIANVKFFYLQSGSVLGVSPTRKFPLPCHPSRFI